MNEFQTVLSQMLAASGKSLNQVAEFGGVDRAYLVRLLDGSKTNPSLETLMRIYLGIVFDATLAKKSPTMVHGLASLVQAAAMSAAPSKLTER